MLPEWISQYPWWFSAGVAGGAGVSVLIAGVFVLGGRLSPTPHPDPSHRVDGTERRRDEIRTYLQTIGEQYLEGHTVHGETVAFYLPRRDVAITFDAKAYFRLIEGGTHAVLCEHEMPGIHLGPRLPFETPEPEFDPATADAASGTDVAEAFHLLGLSPGAPEDAVTAAYRAKIKDVHPDHGGDPEQFQQVHEAYTTAREAAD